jgi:hypothetical protein
MVVNAPFKLEDMLITSPRPPVAKRQLQKVFRDLANKPAKLCRRKLLALYIQTDRPEPDHPHAVHQVEQKQVKLPTLLEKRRTSHPSRNIVGLKVEIVGAIRRNPNDAVFPSSPLPFELGNHCFGASILAPIMLPMTSPPCSRPPTP